MGLSEAQWFRTIERGDPLPFPVGEAVDYRGFTRLGPGALLFLGMYARDHGQAEESTGFFEAALKHEKSWHKTRAARLLVDLYRDSPDSDKLLQLLRSGDPKLSPYRTSLLSAEALVVGNRFDEALGAWRKLRLDFPSESAKDSAMVSAGLLRSLIGTEKPDSEGEGAALVAAMLAMRATPILIKTLSAVLEKSPAWLKPETSLLVQVRVATGDRDYGLAIRAMRAYLLRAGGDSVAANAQSLAAALLSGGLNVRDRIDALPYALLADFARSYFYGAPSDGAALFSSLASSSAAGLDRDYLFQFYAGRFAKNAGNTEAARKYFTRAAASAPTGLDRDAALWYLADSYLPGNPSEAVHVLADAFPATANPAYFSDVVEQISRAALLGRNGSVLAQLDAACAGGADGKTSARIFYLCARSAENGIINLANLAGTSITAKFSDVKDYAASRYRMAYDRNADQWYRLLSAYRLGLPLEASLDASLSTGVESGPVDANDEGLVPLEYALELLRWGLPGRVRPELSDWFGTMSPADIRRVAEALSLAGNHDESIRVIGKAFGREGYRVETEDRQLFWPMPFRAEMDSASADFGIASALLYGLVRSESLFKADVVSRAGAVGLSQLMPATAAETAAKLGMATYSLENPSDNIRIGAAFFAKLLKANGGGVLSALFSYNGGPTRYKRWKADAGKLPDDLLLETLPLEETRQYGRNVVHAATMYSMLHDGTDGRKFLKNALGE